MDVQLFLVNWLLGIFSQQFPPSSVLLLWDYIFAEENSLQRTLLVAVAILVTYRQSVLAKTGQDILALLLGLGKEQPKGALVLYTAQ